MVMLTSKMLLSLDILLSTLSALVREGYNSLRSVILPTAGLKVKLAAIEA